MSKELLIKGGYVVTVDPDLGDLPAGDVLVADGLITAVGPDLEPTTTAAEVIEAAGRLVIPGMVDTHRHVWQGAIGGYTPQITGAGYGPAVQADIAVIDMRSPHLDGFGDPVAVMVLGAGPADVETVIVGGDVVKRDGKLAHDNVDHALELMHATRERLRA
jgi:cytosine/adenosine deaminase-related metal-dependent hydrolase